ncbi:MAG: 2-C-methyl-D-erythritol 4-phosphate cytidylyltransferase [Candidatus Omnitrophica bacterium CG11_big_fil_rev_8_21_14_0_20_42_13]|uniref:2-C-methyl-D-erythritol 4-phosphate cytidylyltransferase n=1 Tax=Candidatus Ghiorseimicrobium undicola TaxID=1974746 RepID=A0A2H0LW54_9BACT|nr:MAG: 2-C-methyl-D-erythritol 4-phosphate cytidylyltransferase [Candidatus Omnitrophica bacterium CG11_big_fil_rev_8_21_14_0_20_42_13]
MPEHLKIEAVVPAAGLGLRLKSRISKSLVLIERIPIVIHTLMKLSRHNRISGIIVLSNKKNLKKLKDLISAYGVKKVKSVSLGGQTRKQSVARGLAYLDRNTELVLIHDGARPFIDAATISAVISHAEKYGAAVSGVPLKPTVKLAGRKGAKNALFVNKTLDRSGLWEIQTPQVFKKDLIVRAHKKFKKIEATDDAYLVEKLGHRVAIVDGSYYNIKITTSEDLVFAKAIAKKIGKG